MCDQPEPRKSACQNVDDSLDHASIKADAHGVDATVHAVNPPGYGNWATLVLPMIENAILAARTSGARILLPGTIYNYIRMRFLCAMRTHHITLRHTRE
jgi:hypothetical protein